MTGLLCSPKCDWPSAVGEGGGVSHGAARLLEVPKCFHAQTDTLLGDPPELMGFHSSRQETRERTNNLAEGGGRRSNVGNG